MSIHQVALLLSDVGLTTACARELAGVREIPGKLAVVAGSTLAVKAGAALASGILLAVASSPLAHAFAAPRLANVLLLAAAALSLSSLFQLFRLGLNALNAAWPMFALVTVESLAEVTASLALVTSAATATSAMTGRIVGYACGCVLGLWLFQRRVRSIGRPARSLITRVVRSGVYIGVGEGVYILLTQVDVLLIGAILGPVAVAQFEAPLRILVVAGFIGYSLGLATTPRLAAAPNLSTHGDRFIRALRFVASLQAALLVPWVIIVAPNATLIFGSGYAESSDVLYALTPYFFLAGIAPLASLVTVYAGGERRRIVPSLLALAVNASITAALLRPIGILAGAIGTVVGSVIYVTLFLSLCGRLLTVPGRSLSRVVVVPLACGAVSAAVALVAGEIHPLIGLAAMVPAIGLHTALLRLTQTVSAEELRELRRLVARPLASLGR